jgi:type I restriction enzyme S subunit
MNLPYEIPENWAYIPFEHVLDVRDGTHDTPKYYENGIPLVTSKNLSNGRIDFSTCKFISIEDSIKINQRSLVESGDILFAMIGSIGNPVLVNKDREFAVKNMAIFKNNNNIDMKYIYYFLLYEQENMKKLSSGGVQSFVSLKFLRTYYLPLPDFEEQKRIVEKLDEVLPLIDSLEKDEIRLKELMQQFPDRMSKSVIKNAILGKITDEIDSIENASEELIQIFGKKVEFANKEDFPYDLPENWALVKHNSLIDLSGGSQPPKSYFTTSQKEGYVRLYQIRDYGDFPQPVYIPIEKASKKTIKGDILVARYGGSLGKIFVAEDGAYNVAMAKAIQKKQFLHNRYLMYYYKSDLFQSVITSFTRSAQPGFNKDNLIELLIPVPPFNVQVKIVEKLDNIIALIGNLKNE